ncbi:MAG: hypothetical protein WBV55_22040 [Candidatus Sulfotelmatobacter sp.]
MKIGFWSFPNFEQMHSVIPVAKALHNIGTEHNLAQLSHDLIAGVWGFLEPGQTAP